MANDNSIFYEMSRELPPYGFACVMVAFLSIATFNGIDILIKVYFTFRRRSGLYFWSITLATLGIFFYVLGFIIKYFITVDVTRWIGLAFIIVGWVPMVSCQALALYSRLHLVIRDSRHLKLRAVLAMIVTNAVLFHVPTCVLVFMAETTPARANAYMAYEKVQVTFFTLQECIISGLYIYEACTKVLKPLPEPIPTTTATAAARTTTTTATTTTNTSSTLGLDTYTTNLADRNTLRSIRRHLIYVNVVVVILDVVLLGTQFANFYRVQTTFKPFVYSVKLKLEFAILNRLIAAVRGGNKFSLPGSGGSRERGGTVDGGGEFRWPYGGGDQGEWGEEGEEGGVRMGEMARRETDATLVVAAGRDEEEPAAMRAGDKAVEAGRCGGGVAAPVERRASARRPQLDHVVLGREDSLQMAALRGGSSEEEQPPALTPPTAAGAGS
ncbi:hypothetical protein SLS55_007167 [Diplodia seriata]|uniref:DUF7703 domain-containing protein n=1 Tax=Diplodia seriata TaxID=420778 RepID=A0ABR3CBG6_9PEZI